LLTRLFLPVGTLWPNYENWFLLESKAQELIAHFRGSFSYTSVKTKLDRCMKMCLICMLICIQIKLFSHGKLSVETQFETEAEVNSEVAYFEPGH